MSAPCSRSDRPKPKIAPSSSRLADQGLGVVVVAHPHRTQPQDGHLPRVPVRQRVEAEHLVQLVDARGVPPGVGRRPEQRAATAAGVPKRAKIPRRRTRSRKSVYQVAGGTPPSAGPGPWPRRSPPGRATARRDSGSRCVGSYVDGSNSTGRPPAGSGCHEGCYDVSAGRRPGLRPRPSPRVAEVRGRRAGSGHATRPAARPRPGRVRTRRPPARRRRRRHLLPAQPAAPAAPGTRRSSPASAAASAYGWGSTAHSFLRSVADRLPVAQRSTGGRVVAGLLWTRLRWGSGGRRRGAAARASTSPRGAPWPGRAPTRCRARRPPAWWPTPWSRCGARPGGGARGAAGRPAGRRCRVVRRPAAPPGDVRCRPVPGEAPARRT